MHNNNSTENKWTVTVEEDPNTGELMIPFPADLLAQMGWAEGTDIWWDVQDDGKVYIREHKSEEKKSEGSSEEEVTGRT